MIRLAEVEKLCQRGVAKRLGISETTANEIPKRERIAVGERVRVAEGRFPFRYTPMV